MIRHLPHSVHDAYKVRVAFTFHHPKAQRKEGGREEECSGKQRATAFTVQAVAALLESVAEPVEATPRKAGGFDKLTHRLSRHGARGAVPCRSTATVTP
jgi:hypothetical protein